MQALDASIFTFINNFAQSSVTLDIVMRAVTDTPLLKHGLLVALLWWTWKQHPGEGTGRPINIVRVVVGIVIVVALARGLQNYLPVQPRPLHDPALAGVLLPHGVTSEVLQNRSSFPSDKAAIAFAMATAVFHANRAVGWFAFAWAIVTVAIPRVYLGFHFPSDIVGALLIAVPIMMVAIHIPLPTRVCVTVTGFAQRWSGLFHAFLFLITFQFATLFEDVRNLAKVMHLITSPDAGDRPPLK